MRSLAERVRAYEQQKARLAETEAKLKEAERRARVRRLIETGGLIEKAGLIDLPIEALYGALLSLRGGVDNTRQREQWAATGSQALAEEARTLDEGREPIVLTFPATLDKDTTAALREGGFRFNKVLRHWEGLARFEDAQQLAGAHGGVARKVGPSSPTHAAPDISPASKPGDAKGAMVSSPE